MQVSAPDMFLDAEIKKAHGVVGNEGKALALWPDFPAGRIGLW